MDKIIANPFAVQTPEGISAPDVVSLFVNVFTDFYQIQKDAHVFLHGHRGSGKSMMFRYMEPDCQMEHEGCALNELPYYGAYVPVKLTDLNLIEYARLHNKYADIVLNEHAMTVFFAIKVFLSLQDRYVKVVDNTDSISDEFIEFYNKSFIKFLERLGWDSGNNKPDDPSSIKACLSTILDILDNIYFQTLRYLKNGSFVKAEVPYSGPLLGYFDFFFPLMKDLRELSFMPEGPIYMLVDDADNLSEIQTSILNSWVSYRTTNIISLKISTQMKYKTYRTSTGQRIDTPHDYSDINIHAVYTSKKGKYKDRIKEIIDKRLKKFRIDSSPDDFFPEDAKQEKAVIKKGEERAKKWSEGTGSYRPGDDAYRYARPDYMKSLGGSSKNMMNYRYAGLDQLIHISSGVIRYFLEAASLMYGECRSKHGDEKITSIPPTIQNEILRNLADEAMHTEFDKLHKEEQEEENLEKLKKLRNLINTLGSLFRQILISEERTERRVFSIALSNEPSSEVKDVLNLGVQEGYLHEALIGNKEGTGRTKRYILSRRLAPHFNLDPTGFSGYKFCTGDFLHNAIHKPDTTISRIKSKGIDTTTESPQTSMFD